MKALRQTFMAAVAVTLCLAFSMLVSAKVSAGECSMYGIAYGSSGAEAHQRFLRRNTGWSLESVDDQGDGWVTISYRQSFKNEVAGNITMMVLNGSVSGVITIFATQWANEAGLRALAEYVAINVQREIITCGASVSKTKISDLDSYFADQGKVARLYHFEHSDGILSLVVTFGDIDVVHGILRELLLKE